MDKTKDLDNLENESSESELEIKPQKEKIYKQREERKPCL